jgi:glycosyltransferase involved in cell wall biosynthesis
MSKHAVKILFIGPHRPNRNPSQRFRIEQYFPYLQEEGFTCDYSWFIDEHDDKIFYSAGNLIGKSAVLIKAVMVRLRDLMRANRYDIIFVQREAFMTGTTFFERQFARSKAKLVFDFDDAIWLEETSEANQKLNWLKRASKTADIIQVSDMVIAGNHYLASYAQKYNKNVVVIPTVVDTTHYIPALKSSTNTVCIGWSGSKTTIKHLRLLIPVLKLLKEKFGDQVSIKQISDKNFEVPGLPVESSDWNLSSEVTELNKIDIGLMPLPDDEWSKGKCGFKAILYMAMEIPPVVSPVGVNTEIIQHGENGFLAANDEDWMNYISALVESPGLRKAIGLKARETVEKKYSVQSQKKKLVTLLRNLLNQQ